MIKTIPYKVLIAASSGNIFQGQEKELLKNNIQIQRVISPEELSGIIHKSEFDLLLIDLDATFSAEMIIKIFGSSKKTNAPILILSSSSRNKQNVNDLYGVGITEIIPKTIKTNRLISKILFLRQFHINAYNTQNKITSLEKEVAILKTEGLKNKNIYQKIVNELSIEIKEGMAVQLELQKKNQLLAEKNRILHCMNGISKLAKETSCTLDDFLSLAANSILSSCRPSPLVCVEIQYYEKTLRSKNFKKTRQKISCSLMSSDTAVGKIVFYYKSDQKKIISDTFLKGGKYLLSVVASELGQIIHQKETDQKLTIFEKAIDQSPLMISITNATTKKLEYVNQKFFQLTGYNKDELNQLLHLTNNQKFLLPINELREDVLAGKTWTGTFRYKTKNGELFWQKAALYPILEQDKISHLLSIGEDVTKELKNIEELRTTKENYEHIIENAPGGIFIVNDLGHFLYVNKKACQISGYTVREILKIHLKELIHPEDYKQINQKLNTGMPGKALEYETRIITKTGDIRTVEVSGLKTRLLDEVVDFIIVNDVTEKKRFSDLLNIQNRIDYLTTIPTGLMKSVEKVFKVLLQFNWIDIGGLYLLNKNKDGLELIYSQGGSDQFIEAAKYISFESPTFKIISKKKPVYTNLIDSSPAYIKMQKEGIMGLCVIPLLKGNKLFGSLNIATKKRINLSDNEIEVFKAIGHKIAQMVLLIEYQDKLLIGNRKLQESLKQVNEKQQQLIQKSKLESLGEMAAGVAHEINQPLGVIQLSLENIAYKVTANKSTPTYLNDKLTSIFNNINKIEEIITHIRTFSRDQKSILIDRVDVNAVIMDAVSLIKEQYKYHNISIHLGLKEKKTEVLGHRHKLEQVMYNLLSNAKYALDEKENFQGESQFKKEIKIRTYLNHEKVFIDVEDNGVGIMEKHQRNIFSPFFTTKPEGKGTGLGLSIVYGIITEMSGSITIESKPNEYTLAHIELPKIS